MDKWQAQQAFWESFGLDAYNENTVPTGTPMPYITYEASASGLGNRLSLTASIWYRDSSWKAISNKAKEILDEIADGKTFSYDGGGMIIWGNRADDMSEPTDDMVRRIRLDVTIEFIGG